jgi:ankyrin repeat protein
MYIQEDEPLAKEITAVIRAGDTVGLKKLLEAHEGLSKARIETKNQDYRGIRSLLHIATDWPGRIPNGPEVIRLLVTNGADVNAKFQGAHAETPLHWAASNNDVEALDALLDAGADIEAGGSVIDGGTALSDAVAFGQWDTAHRLTERGAKQLLWHAAALGNMDEVRRFVEEDKSKNPKQLNQAFWLACHGGQREAAEYLRTCGADINWVGYDGLTPLDVARRSGADDLASWLVVMGGRTAKGCRPL